jgi:hypothetical protein
MVLSCIYLWQIMENWGEKYRLLVEQRALFGVMVTKENNRSGAPIGETLKGIVRQARPSTWPLAHVMMTCLCAHTT